MPVVKSPSDIGRSPLKQVCTLCDRTASDGNLWCQEIDCPIGQMPSIFSYGEPFGDLEIVKVVTVLPASAVYEAVRGGQPVLLKIAHDGYQARLKREAKFLWQLQEKKILHPMLPTLLPAHRGTTIPYSKSAFQGRMKYYCIFEHSDGDTLREFLLKDPQPWFQHAGWIALGLADVVGLLHQEGLLHLALCPESVQVRFESNKEYEVPRIKLLDLGAATDHQNVALDWHNEFVPMAYTAPELMGKRPKANASTDIYGIGLILYELLAGHPAFEFRLREKAAIRKDVLQSKKQGLSRDDLTTLPPIAERATQLKARMRYQSAEEILQELLSTLPPLPKEKSKRKWDRNSVIILLLAAILIPMLLVLALIASSNIPVF